MYRLQRALSIGSRALSTRVLSSITLGPKSASFSIRSFASSSTPQPQNGIINFNLADIGEGIAEVEVLRWFVKPGDRIAQFDNVCEVQSDKATVPITSRYDGIVREVKYEVGQMAKVGSPLITIELDKDHAHAAPAKPAAASSSNISSSSSSSSSSASSSSSVPMSDADFESSLEKVRTSPAVRRLAREQNIDLRIVPASGPDGRILKEDVLKFIETGVSKSAAPASKPAPQTTPTAKPAPKPAPATISTISKQDQVISVSGLQRVMVQTMTAANQVPQLGFTDEICMDALASIREHTKAVAQKHGLKLSYLPFILKAVSLALNEYPVINSHVTSADCSSYTIKGAHNLGVAMDTPRGLLVPNIKNCEEKSILDIARELTRLQQLGKDGQLGKEELSGGTLTLSNIGSIGGTVTRPILLLPEVMIGGLGAIQTLPRYDKHHQVQPTKILTISWSADHRILDGATVAKFSRQVKTYLEQPDAMLLMLK